MERIEDWAACQEACLVLRLSLPVRMGDVGKPVPFPGPQFPICEVKMLVRSSLYLHGSMRSAKLYYVLGDIGQLALVGSALLGGVSGFS